MLIVPHEGSGGARRPSRRSVSDWGTIPAVQERLGGSSEVQAGFERSSRRSGRGQEALPEYREWTRGHPEDPGAVKRPPQRSWRGRESHPEVREGLEGLQRSVRNWEALQKVLEWLAGPPGGQGVVRRHTWRSGGVGRPSQRSGRGWTSRVGLLTPPEPAGGSPRLSKGPHGPPG